MNPTGPTWYQYFTEAVAKGMSLEEAKEFAKEFGPTEAKEGLAKLKA
jgi:hypothetical protein